MDTKYASRLAFAAATQVPGMNKAGAMPGGDSADFSLKQLSDVVIASVSQREERQRNPAAPMFIITALPKMALRF